MNALDELMAVRDRGMPTERLRSTGADPILPTRFPLGGWAGDILLAVGVAVNDLWQIKTGRRQDLRIDKTHAAAALRSYLYLTPPNEGVLASFAGQRERQRISTPHPTKDGRYFLPHMGLPHLAERILKILDCDYELGAVQNALLKWDALALEEAVAEAQGCGAMVRTEDEWLSHPHGALMSQVPVIEIEKIGESDPVPMPGGDRPLDGIRMLDLTRILAGPTCARTLAEHGADVLMVTADHLPQSDFFVMDTSHGKRTCFLDLKQGGDYDQLLKLLETADIFSQGYRPGVMSGLGLSPEDLAERRPGIIYTSMNCYGYDGPFQDRAGWEQLAQTVTGIAAEEGGSEPPRLLPAAACDYSTGYLAAYGTLLALARRAREGGSYHVKASLCQSGMFLLRQNRLQAPGEGDIDPGALEDVMVTSRTPLGDMKHLGPVLSMSETPPHWVHPSSPLGTHSAAWV